MPYDLKRLPRTDSQPAEAARVGEELRESRLALGVSLEELADQLRINRRYLAALEEGRVRDLPGVAYGTGFVRSYAQAMGLDAPDLVRRFREGAGAATRSKDLVFPEPVPDRGVPAGAVILLGAVLAIGGYAAWYQWSGSAERNVDAVPPLPPRLEQSAREAGLPPLPNGSAGGGAPAAPGTPPAAAPQGTAAQGTVPQAAAPGTTAPAPNATAPRGATPAAPQQGTAPGLTPGASAPVAPGVTGPGTQNGVPVAPGTTTPAPAAPAPPPLAPSGAAESPAGNGQAIVLRASQDSWVQVRDSRSGRVVFSRVLRPGETYDVPQAPNLVLTTGKAEALAIEVGGVPSPAMAEQVGVRRDIPLDAARLRDAQPGQLPTR